jgi:hypothetical protein
MGKILWLQTTKLTFQKWGINFLLNMNNRISGDFDSETLEAFRAMYAQQQVAPKELEVDKYTGLPTDVITNVSPWIEHTGLWKANPGTDRDFVPNQVLKGSVEQNFEDIRDFDGLSAEELDALTEKVISEIEEEEAFADLIYNSDDEDEDDPNVYRGEADEELSDDELERIINSIIEDNQQEEENALSAKEDMIIGGDTMSDEDLDNLINELLADTDELGDKELEDLEEEDNYSDDDLEVMIRELLSEEENSEIPYDEDESVNLEDVEDVEDDGDVEEEMSEDEIDNLIDQIMAEFDDDSNDDDYSGDDSED